MIHYWAKWEENLLLRENSRYTYQKKFVLILEWKSYLETKNCSDSYHVREEITLLLILWIVLFPSNWLGVWVCVYAHECMHVLICYSFFLWLAIKKVTFICFPSCYPGHFSVLPLRSAIFVLSLLDFSQQPQAAERLNNIYKKVKITWLYYIIAPPLPPDIRFIVQKYKGLCHLSLRSFV